MYPSSPEEERDILPCKKSFYFTMHYFTIQSPDSFLLPSWILKIIFLMVYVIGSY